VLAVTDYLVRAHDSPIVETSTHFGTLYASRFLPLFWIVCNLWMISLCLRQSGRLGRKHARLNEKSSGMAGSLSRNTFGAGGKKFRPAGYA
jgi:hypothetical protein